MSALVKVMLSLNRQGLKAFPAVLRQHKKAVSTQPGFVSLKQWTPEDSSGMGMVHLVLEFKTRSQLARWRASEEHSRIGSLYKPLLSQAPLAEFYTVK